MGYLENDIVKTFVEGLQGIEGIEVCGMTDKDTKCGGGMNTFGVPTAVIWGYGKTYNQNLNLVKYQEIQNHIKIVGITGENIYHKSIDGYPVVSIWELDMVNFDYLVIAAEKYYREICEEATKLGIERNTIIDIRAFGIPNFDFRKYIKLIEPRISIIANNCWGGVVYHLLRMQFQSPFINMFVTDKDYIKLLKNLPLLKEEKIEFEKWNWQPEFKKEYPVYKLGDLRLYFNHYFSKEEAEMKWYERLKRINWDNLFIMMYTEDISIAKQFDKLDFKRKVCFVPFECDLKSTYTPTKPNESTEFWKVVTAVPQNQLIDYNVIDMLLGGAEKYEEKNRRICKKNL